MLPFIKCLDTLEMCDWHFKIYKKIKQLWIVTIKIIFTCFNISTNCIRLSWTFHKNPINLFIQNETSYKNDVVSYTVGKKIDLLNMKIYFPKIRVPGLV